MAAQVKKYDPNQYNFGDFAKTMNQNFAIERTQNGQGGAFGVNAGVNAANPVNLGGTTNSQTLGNLGTFGTRDRYNNITGNFTGLLKKFNNGETVVSYDGNGEAVVSNTGTQAKSFKQFSEEYKPYGNGLMQGDNVISNWNGQPPQTQTPQQEPKEEIITEEEPEEEIITEEEPKQEVTYPTLERFIGIVNNQVNAGEGAMDFETWQSAYSVDPVVEYQNAQAQLDYEFKTWMSDYGARAEQLYQMGLSNSGVSDIYGANAYTAYVQASMDLKRAQIQQQKENRQMYQKYVDEYEAAKAAKTEAANLKMSSAFNTYSASYHPGLEASVRASLAATGMSLSEINTVIGNLNAYYYALPEDQRPDVVAGNATVDAAVSWLNTNYTSGMTDEELSAMLGATYSADVVQKALEKFAPFKAVIDRLAGDEAAKNAFSAMLEMVSAGDTDVESLKAKAKGLGYSEDAIAKAAENILPFVSGVSANDTLIKALAKEYEAMFKNGYTGSAEDIVNVRQMIEASENAQYADQIIAQMNANLKERETATVDTFLEDIEGTDADTVDLSAIDELLVTAENQYGKDSDQYNEIVGTVQAKADEAIKKLVLSYPSNVNEFATRLGIDPELYVVQDSNGNDINWNSADEDQKRIIMDVAVTDLYKNNGISQEAYVAYMNKSISLNIREEKNTKGVLDVALAVKDLDLDNQTTNALLSKIYESISFRNFNWTGDYVTVKTGIGNDKVSFAVGQPLNVTEEDLKVNGITRSGFVKYGNHIYYCSYENKKIVRIEGVRGSEGYTGEYENILFDVLKSSKTIKMFSFEQKKQDVNVDTGKKLTENGVVNTKTITLPNGEVVTIEDNDISVK